jgi:DNA-binding PadR family transcriptional regulator
MYEIHIIIKSNLRIKKDLEVIELIKDKLEEKMVKKRKKKEKDIKGKKKSTQENMNECNIEDIIKTGDFDKTLLSGFMKGFLKIIVLWIITKERIHGYEIIKKMKVKHEESEEINFRGPGPNKIYPILHELEKKELIRGDWELQGKRKLKYYEATEKGMNTIDIIRVKPHKDVPPIIKEFWQEVISPKEKISSKKDINE